MADVTMPRLSDTMKEGVIAVWHKKEGDEIKKGDILADIETDKATMDLEAFENGVLDKIVVQPGETVPIGTVVAIIRKAGEVANTAPAKASTPASSQPAQAAPVSAQAPAAAVSPAQSAVASAAPANPRSSAPAAVVNERVKASPLARKLAGEYQLDLHSIRGTGPNGRVLRDDVEAARNNGGAPIAATPAPQETPAPAPLPAGDDVEIINMSMMQQTVARRLTESKQQVPHFYVSTEVDMTEAVKLREQLNAKLSEGGVKVSFNDLVVKGVAIALERMPEVNTYLKDGKFYRNKKVNIGIAVDVPNGLVVPVLRDANIKGVRSLAKEAKALAEKARNGKLRPEDYTGGTFSISNLGMFNVTNFQAVINPPESAILAVGTIIEKPVVVNHEIVVRHRMSLTLSADHRVLYGATIARFLGLLQALLENPFELLG
jgi:pyruvate dehydrogenase E2 component (dihydrolipoamide acetyltransferase)